MSQLASPSQLRMSLLRWALFIIPVIMLLGFLSGTVSGSGEDNAWFAELVKPEAQPPGWAMGYGLAWIMRTPRSERVPKRVPNLLTGRRYVTRVSDARLAAGEAR